MPHETEQRSSKGIPSTRIHRATALGDLRPLSSRQGMSGLAEKEDAGTLCERYSVKTGMNALATLDECVAPDLIRGLGAKLRICIAPDLIWDP